MLFLSSVALCSLYSVVAMAADLVQDQLSLTRTADESVSFSCTGTEQCSSSYILWYQKKETETFKLILDIDKNNGKVDSGYNHPQKDDFSAERNQNSIELKIQKVKVSHSATYYCSCWKLDPDYYYNIFGSGTRLYVTDERVVKPKVSVYPASRAGQKGKSSLLCLARSMFPPLVQFFWKREKNGQTEELPTTERDQVELRESEHTAAIMLIDHEKAMAYEYRCSVKHEGGTVEAPIAQRNEDPPVTPTTPTAPTCPPEGHTADPPPPDQPDISFQSQCRVKLVSLVYTGMIVKSMVYCCGLSLLIIHRNKGRSTRRRAD